MFIILILCSFFIQPASAKKAKASAQDVEADQSSAIRLTLPGSGKAEYDLTITDYALPDLSEDRSPANGCWLDIAINPGSYKGIHSVQISSPDDCTTVAEAANSWSFVPSNDWGSLQTPPPLKLKLVVYSTPAGPQIAVPANKIAWRTQLPQSVHSYEHVQSKKRTAPRYPVLAKSQNVEADCGVKLKLDTKGKVTSASITEGGTYTNSITNRVKTQNCPDTFHESVLNAAKQWTFKPLRIDNTNVATDYTLSFRFKIQ